ncbi:MAG: O-antigen ligase family protein [Bacteroidia bacterium]
MGLSSENANEAGVTRQKIHRWFFLFVLSFIGIGLSTSKAFMSMGEMALAANWLIEGNYAAKWKKFTANKAALVLCSFYIMHLLSLIYSTDFAFAAEDIRIKIPLLILPFLFCTSEPLSEKERNLVLSLFMGGITFVSILGTYRLLHHSFIDIHKISVYVSSPRLALYLDLAIFLLLGYVFTKKWSWLSFLLIVWAIWFFAFIIIMESLDGIVILTIVALILLVYYIVKWLRQKKIWYGIALLSLIGMMAVSITLYLIHFYHHYFPEVNKSEYAVTDDTTLKGNHYYRSLAFKGIENGHLVGNYVQPNELEDAWNKRSKIPYDSLDRKGNLLQYTLVRYLTSMNLRKDSAGLSKITDNDIKAIERGIPNYNFTARSSMDFRIYQVFWEIDDYMRGGNISGHSVIQRLEFWKAAVGIIKQHWLIGVGTGDVRKAFDRQYDVMHSALTKNYRLRAHNQFLEIGVASGIIGIIWLIFSLIYPGIKTRKLYTYIYVVFWLIAILSMFNEDTLETQAGATFYAFFNSFFLFLA